MSAKRSKFHGLFPVDAELPAAVPITPEQPLPDQTGGEPFLDADAARTQPGNVARNQEIQESRFQDFQDSRLQETSRPRIQETEDSRLQETKRSRKEVNKNSRILASGTPGPAEPVRLKTNYEIRQDYHRKLKNIANDEGRKMYQVIEEAIARYLRSKGRL